MSELQKRLRALAASAAPYPSSGGTPQTLGCERMRIVAVGRDMEAITEAADALDAQAQEIASLRARAEAAEQELRNIKNSRRWDRAVFDNQCEWGDWVLSRCRHALTRAELVRDAEIHRMQKAVEDAEGPV